MFWVFAAFAVLYGFCETMNGNWSQLDLTALHVSATTASLTLTVFWAMVTAGRVVFAAIQRWVPSRLAYHGLPFLLAGAFVFIALLPPGPAGSGVVAFGVGPLRSAGLRCPRSTGQARRSPSCSARSRSWWRAGAVLRPRCTPGRPVT